MTRRKYDHHAIKIGIKKDEPYQNKVVISKNALWDVVGNSVVTIRLVIESKEDQKMKDSIILEQLEKMMTSFEKLFK